MAKRFYAFSLYKKSGLYLALLVLLLFLLFYFAFKFDLARSIGIPLLLLFLSVGFDVLRFYVPGKIGKAALSNSYEVQPDGVTAHSIFNLRKNFSHLKAQVTLKS